MKTRREFLKDSCKACLGTAFLGITLSQLEACASLPVYKTDLTQKLVEVPLASFGESNVLIMRDLQVEYDVLLVKKSSEQYLALYMCCTHRENPLTATATGLYCSAHGSAFDLDGNVTKAPANEPLKRFTTEVKQDKLYVHVLI